MMLVLRRKSCWFSGKSVHGGDSCWRALCAVALLVGSAIGESCEARDVEQRIQQAFVPPDKPEIWPAGEWEALAVDEFRQLRKDLDGDDASPPRATLERVTYSATWSGSSSLDGEFRAETSLREHQVAFLPLGRPTLSIKDLAWDDRPAIWGTAPDGRSLLRVESDGEHLTGNWSLQGHESLGELEFHAVLPPAVLTRFELRLPAGKHLRVNEGIVAVQQPDVDPDWQLWRLDMGRETTLHLVVSDQSQQLASPHLVVQRMSRYSVLPEGIRFRVSFTVDHLQGEVDELTFSVPREMQVSTIMLGTDLDLPFQLMNDEGDARVTISLDSISLRPRGSISLQGTMQLPSEQTWTVPRISVHNAHLWESGVSISISRPLELSDFTLRDCRLTSSMMNWNQSDVLELEDWAESSSISVSLDTPQAEIACDVLTTLTSEVSQSMMHTLLKLSTQSGSLYQLPFFVPDGWQVTSVSSLPSGRANTIAQWKTTVADDGTTLLDVEFRDALTPAKNVFIEISARSVVDLPTTSLLMPVIRPAESMPNSVAMSIHPQSGQKTELPPDSPYQERTLAEATSAWINDLEGTTWSTESIGSDGISGNATTYFTNRPTDADRLLISSQAASTAPSNTTASLPGPKDASRPLATKKQPILHLGEPSWSGSLIAEMTVETFASRAAGQPCVHVVKYVLPVSAVGKTLDFTLAETASFIAARAGHLNHAMITSDQKAEIWISDEAKHREIELEYRTDSSHSLLSEFAEIPLPRSVIQPSSIQWKLHLPPSFRLGPGTTGSSFEHSKVGWMQRLIGPLGRDSGRTANRLLSENDQVASASFSSNESRAETSASLVESIAADSSKLHLRSVPFSATTLRLEMWKGDTSQRIGWCLLIASCLAIGLIRLTFSKHCCHISLLLSLSAGILTVLVPDTYAIPCGGLFIGTLSGMLLPQNFWQHRMTKETTTIGSTRRSPVMTATPILVLIVVLGIVSQAGAFQKLTAGPSSTPSVAEDNEPVVSVDLVNVLIPIKSEPPTLDATPVVYVSSSLLEKWHAVRRSVVRSPDYLLRDAEYAVTFDQRPFPRMKAVFDVVLLNPSTNQIRLPIDGIAFDGDNACRINGKGATVIPLRSGHGISVDLSDFSAPSLPATGKTDSLTSPDPSFGPSGPQVMRIELNCRLRGSTAEKAQQVDVAIPQLLSATALLTLKSADESELRVHRLGRNAHDQGSHQSFVELGPVLRLQIDSPSSEPFNDEWLPGSALSSVTVHPQHLNIESRLQFFKQGSTSSSDLSIDLLLPPDATVNNVDAPDLERWEVKRRADNPITLRLSFSRPVQAGAVTFDIDYGMPRVPNDGLVTIPALRFLPIGFSREFSLHGLALTAAQGFRIEKNVAAAQADLVTRMAPEKFKQQWGSELTSDPDATFVLKAPLPLGVPISLVTPARDATITEQIIVERSTLKCQANIELNCTSAPVARHDIRVDPRLKVTSVSITQNGAEHLVRWTQENKTQLILLLDHETSGTQQVRVSGHLAYEAREDLELPRVSVPAASIDEHSLEISCGRELTFVTSGENASLLSDMPAKPDPSSGKTVTFDLLKEQLPISIRVDEIIHNYLFDRIVHIQTGNDGDFRVTTQILLPTDSPLPPKIQLDVPDELAVGTDLEMSFQPNQQTTGKNGHLILTVPTSMTEPEPSRFTISAVVSASESRVLHVPLISVSDGQVQRQWLILDPEVPLDFDDGHQVTEMSDAEQQLIGLSDSPVDELLRVFRPHGESWTLNLQDVSTTGGLVRGIETILWDDNDQSFSAVTSMKVSVLRRNELRISLPSEVALAGIEWNGGEVAVEKNNNATLLTVPLNSAIPATEASSSLTIWWTLQGQGPGLQQTIPLPFVQNMPLIEHTVAVFGSDESKYEISGGVVRQLTASGNGLTLGFDSPSEVTKRALLHAGIRRREAPLSDKADTISVLHFDQHDVRDADGAPFEVTVWIMTRQSSRIILVILALAVLLVFGWKTRLYAFLQEQFISVGQSSFAGPTLLASLVWIAGPAMLGFWLTLLSCALWAMSIWVSHYDSTSFEYNSPTPN